MNQVIRIREQNGLEQLQIRLWQGPWLTMKTTKDRGYLVGEIRTKLDHDFAHDTYFELYEDCESEGWELSIRQESRRVKKRASQLEQQIPPENKIDLSHARQDAAEELGYFEYVIRIQPVVDEVSFLEAST